MLQSLCLLYEQVEAAPTLHLLNPYRYNDRDSMKFYTDPSLFFNLWIQSMVQFSPNHHLNIVVLKICYVIKENINQYRAYIQSQQQQQVIHQQIIVFVYNIQIIIIINN
ncbi:unnamed protein product [Rotaria sp. Silwood2]|nr:unnamed protein product [Rotaria sp. Silwood2]CAF4125372.1 unnamed protein product [Rotaria sp. Silwood2]